MKKEEHKEILTKLKNSDDTTEKIELLMTLEKDYNTLLNEIEENKINLENISKERDNYAKLNNDLWLSNNAQNKDNVNKNNENSEPPKKRTFSDLEAKLEEEYNK